MRTATSSVTLLPSSRLLRARVLYYLFLGRNASL
jgi:hypothetical protein